tara:strand:- start:940 stop:1050 length:111 start_codon:yes stop_codon:yes gene_type:complete
MIIGVIVITIISICWVNGIERMGRDHKDYKGDDFLN